MKIAFSLLFFSLKAQIKILDMEPNLSKNNFLARFPYQLDKIEIPNVN